MRIEFPKNKKGFSLLEIIIVTAIFLTLIGYAVINLFGVRDRSDLFAAASEIIADIKLQQSSAMNGELGLRENYGIYFSNTYYTLFRGSSFNPSDPSNFTVSLADNVEFTSIAFNNQVLIFSYASGEVLNYNPLANSFIIRNKNNNEEKRISVNKYGALTIE